MKRVLFICKRRPAFYGASYGLLNSCRFICNALHDMGVDAKTVEVDDNNDIDREVHNYKPTHVFVEALWVVPEKFGVLISLYPNIKWYVRLHSNIPFLANEGMAIDWIIKYFSLQTKYPQFRLSSNSTRMISDLKNTFHADVVYAPNIYQPHIDPNHHHHHVSKDKDPKVLSVGCFGAIRPLKNQLIQAMATISFADEIGLPLKFHINHARIEMNGENIYKNLVFLFQNGKHELITHDWMEHEDFMALVKKMDMGLQVSFSETFNLVAADFVHLNVPIIGSPEIRWLSSLYQANPTDFNDIVSHMWIAWWGRKVDLQAINKLGLNEYNNVARKVWKKLLDLC